MRHFQPEVLRLVTGFFTVGLFAVGQFAVGQFVVEHFAVRTVRRKDSLP